MKLPKFLTTVTTFSKILAMILFILFPILSFKLGISYKKKLDTLTFVSTPTPLPIISPVKIKIPSPNKPGWLRYMSDDYDYYFDYPNTYVYNKQGDDDEILFEKNLVNTPHGIDNYIKLTKGQSFHETKEKISELKKMIIGEKKVVTKDQFYPIMDQFNTYERLPDVFIDNKIMKVGIIKKCIGKNYTLSCYNNLLL